MSPNIAAVEPSPRSYGKQRNRPHRMPPGAARSPVTCGQMWNEPAISRSLRALAMAVSGSRELPRYGGAGVGAGTGALGGAEVRPRHRAPNGRLRTASDDQPYPQGLSLLPRPAVLQRVGSNTIVYFAPPRRQHALNNGAARDWEKPVRTDAAGPLPRDPSPFTHAGRSGKHGRRGLLGPAPTPDQEPLTPVRPTATPPRQWTWGPVE